jgi:dTDP-glucose 4,6-dehydratase
MQNILVTGGCGFIGTNFIRLLFDNVDFRGRVINVDKLTYAGNPENLADVEDAFQGRYFFIMADICDAEAINDVLVKYNIDTVCYQNKH